MIIRAIRAENFMKFASLGISSLPAKGIIGIEGPNESGKTTIGEAILFAFFGKTRTSLETSVSRLIHWGADYLSVEVEFHVFGRGDFMIYREIDKYGTNFVKVIDSTTRTEVAAGNVNVSEFLARTLKFDFFEFHQSFYHDQRQASQTAEAQASFVERMTGITQIRESEAALKKEIEQLEREFAHYQKDVQRNLQQMEKYARSASKLPELRETSGKRTAEMDRSKREHKRLQDSCAEMRRFGEDRQAVARRLEGLLEEPAGSILAALGEIRACLEGLSQGAPLEREFTEKNRDDLSRQTARIGEIEGMLRSFGSLREAFAGLAEDLHQRLDPAVPTSFVGESQRLEADIRRTAARGRRCLAGALGAFLATVLAGGLGGAIWMGKVAHELLQREPALWACGGILGICLIFLLGLLVARGRASRRLRQLQQLLNEQEFRIREDTEEREHLAAILAISGPGEVARFLKESGVIVDPHRAGLRREFLREHRRLAELEGDNDFRKELQALARLERDFRGRAIRDVQRLERSFQEAEGTLKKARAELEKLENEIRECEAQALKKEVLSGKNQELEARSAEIRKEMDLRRLSIELLDDAAATIRNKIGPALSRFLKEILPRLTSGRYREIKVGSDLSLQIFTGDKGDFLDRSELSGGTQEALALALRLAASQAFIDSRTRQSQFIFLDEPFKMMDDTRALECLKALAGLSSDLQQVFVIQPSFSSDERKQFTNRIRTSLDLGDLSVSLDGEALCSGTAVEGPAGPGPAA